MWGNAPCIFSLLKRLERVSCKGGRGEENMIDSLIVNREHHVMYLGVYIYITCMYLGGKKKKEKSEKLLDGFSSTPLYISNVKNLEESKISKITHIGVNRIK